MKINELWDKCCCCLKWHLRSWPFWIKFIHHFMHQQVDKLFRDFIFEKYQILEFYRKRFIFVLKQKNMACILYIKWFMYKKFGWWEWLFLLYEIFFNALIAQNIQLIDCIIDAETESTFKWLSTEYLFFLSRLSWIIIHTLVQKEGYLWII